MSKSQRGFLLSTGIVASLALTIVRAAPALAFDPAKSGYTEIRSDDFKTIPSQWESSWWYQNLDSCEQTFIPKSQVPGSNGLILHIQSLETVPACAGTMHDYSYAHLDAFGTAYSNAYWEASIRTAPKAGTLTAWWLLPESGAWPPEVDITEVRGDAPKTSNMTNHYTRSNLSQQYVYNASVPLSNAFHTYGVLLDGKTITWYLDGVKQGQAPERSGESGPLFPVLSLYTGDCNDGWAGCPQGSGTTPLTGWSANAEVRWVHVWIKTKG